jgi:glyoxylase-like metal-dependent hydrolase (beta-lactamase superfamily II)
MMQEIANHVFIDTQYPGVTLGAISRKHGLILVDSPFRQDDARSWRSALLNLGGGIARMLIQMDAHMDRTMGAKALECTILSHHDAANAFQNRPASIKAQTVDAGAEWESFNGLGSIRWGTPHITFTEEMMVHWDDSPIRIQHKPGISEGSIWAELLEEKIIFLGDAVVCLQTPFLGSGNFPEWIQHLSKLVTPEYQDYFFVGGRNGLVTIEDIHEQISFLSLVNDQLLDLASFKTGLDAVNKLVPDLMKKIRGIQADQYDLFAKRLAYGLQTNYSRRFLEKNSKREN